MNSTGNVLPTPTAEPQVVFRNHGTSELYTSGTDHIADPSLEGNLIQSMTGQDLFGNLLESSNMDFQSTQVDFQATRTEHQLGTEEELQFDFNMDVSELLRSPTTVMCELGTGDTQMGASSGGIQSYPKSASLAPLGNGNQTGNPGDQINKDGTGVQGNGSSHSLETTQQPECLPTNGNGNGHLPLVTNTVDAGAYPNFFQDGGGLSSQMRTHYNLKLKKLKADIKVRDARIEQLQSGVNWKLSMKDAEIAALKAELAKKG
ncbi:hypothetical protein FRX31_029562 [Thalictrum thalictroides]|uniref:Uncharacterized protein n=1 Tax=Thalictrum thalictroides TaxID=46969 RepID=A0A7J6V8C3_THATH|nr:hypothetical protein FRX31_029562 [Thalictrum thalictroides]